MDLSSLIIEAVVTDKGELGQRFIGECPTLSNGGFQWGPAGVVWLAQQAYLNDYTTPPTIVTSVFTRRGLNTFLWISLI